MECSCSNRRKEDNRIINIESKEISKKDQSHYLKSIIHKEGDIEDNIRNRTQLVAKIEELIQSLNT